MDGPGFAQERPVNWFPEPPESEWPADIVRLARRHVAEAGFVPNLLRAWVWRPDRLRAWYVHYRSVMGDRDDAGGAHEGLSLIDREVIAVVVSAANGCEYCAVSHGAGLRLAIGDAALADQIAADHRTAGLDPARTAIADYAHRLTTDPRGCRPADLDRLRGLGLSDDAIWDTIEVTAMFNFTNRLTMGAAIVPNDEYRSIGRP